MDFIYDNAGSPYAMIYNGDVYYYVLNLQGDVIRLIDEQGTTAATYAYNAWGEVISSSGWMANQNPIRYRGYFQDNETGFYYLQSRYYDPSIGRFINADSYASTGQDFLGYNMFTYCGNNPISCSDPTGHSWWRDLWAKNKAFLKKQKEKASKNGAGTVTVGATASGAFGVAGSISKGITFDKKGNIGIATTTNIGGGFPSLGTGGFITLSDAPNIHKQSGLGTAVGASGGPGFVAAGAEYSLMVDTEDNKTYNGATFTATAGLYPSAVEVHGEVGYTSVVGVNVYDVLMDFADIMIQIEQGG